MSETSSEFSLVFWISCSFIEARDISSFFSCSLNLVTSASWVRFVLVKALFALKIESDRLEVDVTELIFRYLHIQQGHCPRLHLLISLLLLQSLGSRLALLKDVIVAFLWLRCNLLVLPKI